MTSKRRVNLRAIAEKTGLTRMAVSLALRGRPGVSEETRKEILKIAEELGYQPDPEVAKLLARIRTRAAPADSQSCLALMTSGPTPDQWKKFITERKYVEGAQARAARYGYRIEEFWLGQPGVSSNRRSSILWNRGIEGVIIAPLQERLSGDKPRKVELDYSLFSVVEISETVDWPDLDRTVHDQYTSMLKCLNELRDLNYQRVGLVLEEALDMRVNGKWTAAFLRYKHQGIMPKMPPPLLLAAADQKAFDHWRDRYQPDAVVSVDGFALRMLEARGLKLPKDIGYASLDVDGDSRTHPGLSGIDQNSELVGAAAVDMLVAAIHRSHRGIPAHPMRTEVEGSWINGNSTRRQK
jgi:LacI family transcriptional regulator